MEQVIKENEAEKVVKKQSRYSSFRVSNVTAKRIANLLGKANKKDYGKRVKVEDLVMVGLSLVTDSHIKELQKNSLSNSDLLEIKYKEHIKRNGKISKDEFIGFLLKNTNHSAA